MHLPGIEFQDDRMTEFQHKMGIIIGGVLNIILQSFPFSSSEPEPTCGTLHVPLFLNQ